MLHMKKLLILRFKNSKLDVKGEIVTIGEERIEITFHISSIPYQNNEKTFYNQLINIYPLLHHNCSKTKNKLQMIKVTNYSADLELSVIVIT